MKRHLLAALRGLTHLGILTLAFLPAMGATRTPADSPVLQDRNETAAQHDARMAWWREAKFGLFVHWGLYAQAGGVWKGKDSPGSYKEWIRCNCKIPIAEYAALAKDFNPVNYDAEEWVLAAKNAGLKYLVITAKLLGRPIATILDFVIPGMPGATIRGTGIEVQVPRATDLTKLAPIYQTGSPTVTGMPASGSINDFNKPQFYTITAADSGSKQTPVVYQSYQNEQPVLSGGVLMRNLKWTPYKDGIVQAMLPAGFTTDQLSYV